MMARSIPILLALYIVCGSCHARGEASVGSQAPAFVLKTSTGQVFNSETQLKGRLSVVTFWRLEQAYSNKALRDLQLLRGEYPPAALQVIAICYGTSKTEDVTAAIQELGINFPVLLDPDRTAYAAFGVFVSPSTYIVDQEGTLRFYRPSYTSDFLAETRMDVDLLLGNISEQEHAAQFTAKKPHLAQETVSARAHYRLGLQLLHRGDRARAKDQLRQAWEGSSRSLEAGIELGFLLLDDDAADEALDIFSKAVREAPNRPRIQGGYAAALIRTGQTEKGKELLGRVLNEHPGEPFLYYEMGRIREQEGAGDEARALFRRGLEVALKKG